MNSTYDAYCEGWKAGRGCFPCINPYRSGEYYQAWHEGYTDGTNYGRKGKRTA